MIHEVAILDCHLAVEYGVNEAIFIYHLQKDIEFYRSNNENFIDGKYWKKFSPNYCADLFPFWNAGEFDCVVKSLEKQGVIVVGNFNKNKLEDTKWIAFVDKDQSNPLKTPNKEPQKKAFEISMYTRDVQDVLRRADNPFIAIEHDGKYFIVKRHKILRPPCDPEEEDQDPLDTSIFVTGRELDYEGYNEIPSQIEWPEGLENRLEMLAREKALKFIGLYHKMTDTYFALALERLKSSGKDKQALENMTKEELEDLFVS